MTAFLEKSALIGIWTIAALELVLVLVMAKKL